MFMQWLQDLLNLDLSHLFEAIPFSYIALFPVLNPLGGAFIILSMTLGAEDKIYQELCRRIALNTFVLLTIILIAGTYILRFFGITIPIVQIGGGAVVAFIGWRILNEAPDTTSGNQSAELNNKNTLALAFYPLTMPITAGPGCMAVTLTISAHEMIQQSWEDTLLGQMGSTIGFLLLAVTVYICYRYAEKITRTLGTNGTRVIVRISAFLNFCIGLQVAWRGLESLLLEVLH